MSIKTKIKKKLLKKEILTNLIEITGNKVVISLDDIDNGNNILYEIKLVLDEIEESEGIQFTERYVEF